VAISVENGSALIDEADGDTADVPAALPDDGSEDGRGALGVGSDDPQALKAHATTTEKITPFMYSLMLVR
jgi:hypothetical protein